MDSLTDITELYEREFPPPVPPYEGGQHPNFGGAGTTNGPGGAKLTGTRDQAAGKIDGISEIVASFGFDETWSPASVGEYQLLPDDLMDASRIFLDRLPIQSVGKTPGTIRPNGLAPDVMRTTAISVRGTSTKSSPRLPTLATFSRQVRICNVASRSCA